MTKGFGILSLCLLAPSWASEQTKDDCQTVITNFNVFEESEPGFTWLHDWANWLHLITQERTIEDKLVGFDLCNDPKATYEAERYLRSLSYLRDVKITKQQNEVVVHTWDTWSLIPKFDFSRQGGESKLGLGIMEDNLLGLGISTELAYFDETDRSGYVIDVRSGLFLGQHFDGRLTLVDSDDGERQYVQLNRPFFAMDTRWSTNLAYEHEQLEHPIKQGGDTVNEFVRIIHGANLSWGWSQGREGNHSQRWRVGYDYEDLQFDAIDTTTLLPQNRESHHLWLQWHYLEDHFTEVTNLYLINTVEDVNFGSDYWLRAGFDFAYDKPTFAAGVQQGWQLNSTRRWFIGANAELRPTKDDYQWLIQGYQHHFWQLAERWVWFNRLDFIFSDNQYEDQPISLGGDTDLRGFPVAYQHGEHTALFTNEMRYYPGWSWYQLLEVGAVMFWDIGQAFGDSPYQSDDQDLLQSVGVGLRLYSSHSSNNVIHMDLSHPISDDDEVDEIEWRLEVRSYF